MKIFTGQNISCIKFMYTNVYYIYIITVLVYIHYNILVALFQTITTELYLMHYGIIFIASCVYNYTKSSKEGNR